MSKRLKRIISCTLVLGSLCFAGQISGEVFMSSAKAATVAVQAGEIRTMTVKTYSGDELKYVNNFKDNNKVDYDGNERNFNVVIPDDTEGVKLDFEVKQKDDDVADSNKYIARAFSSSADDAYAYESGDKIEIKNNDYVTLYVRVYKNEDKFKDAKYDDNVSRCYETYKITLKRESAEVDEGETTGSNGAVLSSDNIKLPKIESNVSAEVKVTKNQWVQKGNYWVRYNEYGEILRNTWYQEKGKWYYLQANGYMTTGWRFISGKYYYFDASGAMKTGWVQSNGKYYYLDASGAMVSNTTIDGYKINVSGQYIG